MSGPIAGGPILNNDSKAMQNGRTVILPVTPHTATLQAPSTARNAMGEVTLSFSGGTTMCMAIEPMSGDELMRAQQVDAEVTHRITSKWRDQFVPRNRIQFDGRTFNILSVRNLLEQDIAAEVMAKEVL